MIFRAILVVIQSECKLTVVEMLAFMLKVHKEC